VGRGGAGLRGAGLKPGLHAALTGFERWSGMSMYIRPRLPGASVFVTVCLADRRSHLLVREVAALRSAVVATLIERPVGVAAWVVLPDHMHFVWTLPEGDSGYAVRIGAIKARFTRAVREGEMRRTGCRPDCRPGFSPAPPVATELPVVRSGRYAGLKPGLRIGKREAGVWQRRFWEHHIRGPADFERHVRYCWGNPVRHGLVARAADWPWSSLHRDLRAGRVEADWAGEEMEGAFGEQA